MLLNPLEDIRITSHFGTRIHPVTKKRTFHNGVDLAAEVNTRCLAVADGRVVKSTVNYGGPFKGYGYFMVVEHDGFCTLYAHLVREGLPEGALVKEGQVIAYTGNTGVSSGPHLHFEVHKGKFGPGFFNRIDGRLPATVDPVTFELEPEWIRILKSKVSQPEDWIKFVEDNQSHPLGRWLPQLIVKISK